MNTQEQSNSGGTGTPNQGSRRDPIKIVQIGAGGLGVSASWGILNSWPENLPLELFIVDSDVIELSNLNRQVFFAEQDLGKGKAETLKNRLTERIPFCSNKIRVHSEHSRLSLETIDSILDQASFVVDACDCSASKFLINDYCVSHRTAFCYAGVVSNHGQLMLVPPSKNRGCLRCLFEAFSEHDYNTQTTSCHQAGIIGAVAGYGGFLQAEETLDYLLHGSKQVRDKSELLRFSLAQPYPSRTKVPASANCPLGCSLDELKMLDLRDKKCPETFLFTKLALDQLDTGSLLDLRFSSFDSAKNVAQTAAEHGHRITSSCRQVSTQCWRVIIERGS